MDRIILDADALLREIQFKLGKLDSLVAVNHDTSLCETDLNSISPNGIPKENPFIILQAYVDRAFTEILALIDRLDICVGKEPATSRPVKKLRVDQLKYDTRHLRASYDGILARRSAKMKALREREQLLTTKFTANSPIHNRSSPSVQHQAINIANGNGFLGGLDPTDDHDMKQRSSLFRSNTQVDTLLDAGRNVMDSLRHQRGRLQLTRKRLTDIIGSLGLSNSVMKLIQRRTTQDKFILYGGMIITTILVFIIIIYLR